VQCIIVGHTDPILQQISASTSVVSRLPIRWHYLESRLSALVKLCRFEPVCLTLSERLHGIPNTLTFMRPWIYRAYISSNNIVGSHILWAMSFFCCCSLASTDHLAMFKNIHGSWVRPPTSFLTNQDNRPHWRRQNCRAGHDGRRQG